MADSLGSLIGKKRFEEPPEINIIKKFVEDNFKSTPTVTIRENQIIIGVTSAALAGTLRMQLHQLQQLCQTKKRLIIRIGV